MAKSTTAAAAVTTTKAPRKPRTKKSEVIAVQAELSMNMSAEMTLDIGGVSGDPALDALMAELNGVSLPSDEVILPSEPDDASELVIEAADAGDTVGATDDDLLATAVSGAEMLESYDKADPLVDAASDASEPKAADDAAPAAEKPKKEKKAKAPKEPKEPRTFYGLDKLKRLTDRGVAAVMLKADEELTGDDLAAAQQRTLDVVSKANQKVKNRTSNILEFVTGKTNVLNNLIRVCFNLVETEGVLVTGEKGNMWATLSVCYGAGTIRSGGNNSVAALRDLQIIIQGEKGYVKNPDSALYERIAARLAGAEEPAGEEVAAEEPVKSTGEIIGEKLLEIAKEQQAEVDQAAADPVGEVAPSEAVAEQASEIADAVA